MPEVARAPSPPASPARRLDAHEAALLLLALGTTLALLARTGAGEATARALAAGLAYGGVIAVLGRLPSEGAQKARLASAYAFALWFYQSVAWITPALGTPLQDARLLALDRAILGETPAVALQGAARPWLTDLLSACYLGYHAYLHAALAWALLRPLEETRRLFTPLFTTFALGYAGYLASPAVGPATALPDAFAAPLVGSLPTALNAWVVARGSSVYDAFPSLHTAITCALLAHDLRFARRRAVALALPCLGLLVSTVYLRYHYAVDLVAGAAVFAAVQVALYPRPGAGRRAALAPR